MSGPASLCTPLNRSGGAGNHPKKSYSNEKICHIKGFCLMYINYSQKIINSSTDHSNQQDSRIVIMAIRADSSLFNFFLVCNYNRKRVCQALLYIIEEGKTKSFLGDFWFFLD